MSLKNFSDTIGNRIGDLPTCSQMLWDDNNKSDATKTGFWCGE